MRGSGRSAIVLSGSLAMIGSVLPRWQFRRTDRRVLPQWQCDIERMLPEKQGGTERVLPERLARPISQACTSIAVHPAVQVLGPRPARLEQMLQNISCR